MRSAYSESETIVWSWALSTAIEEKPYSWIQVPPPTCEREATRDRAERGPGGVEEGAVAGEVARPGKRLGPDRLREARLPHVRPAGGEAVRPRKRLFLANAARDERVCQRDGGLFVLAARERVQLGEVGQGVEPVAVLGEEAIDDAGAVCDIRSGAVGRLVGEARRVRTELGEERRCLLGPKLVGDSGDVVDDEPQYRGPARL